MMADPQSSSGTPQPKKPSSGSIQASSASPSSQALSVDAKPTGLTSYFTKSQFALALVIQKSKPEGVSVSDYCIHLRKNIRKHRSVPSDAHRYVDSCEFWKDQYTKIYEQKKVLEDKVHLLEGMQHIQKNTTTPETEDTASLNQNGKRPSALFDEVQELLDPEQENPLPEDTAQLRICRYILQIGQRRIRLENTMKESNVPEHLDNLVKSSSQVLGLLETVLDDCTFPLSSLKCSDNIRAVRLLQQLMCQIVLGFRSCISALNELCLTILGRSKRLGIVYRLVMFFKKSLDHLRMTCTMQAESEIEGRRKTRSKRNKRPKTDSEYAVNKCLCQALISITQIEWKVGNPGHSEILEGILFSILDHTGRLVSNAVFNEHVAISNKPGNITLHHPEPMSDTASLEARYFMSILDAAVGGSSSRKEMIARILCDGRGDLKNQNHQTSVQELTSPSHDLSTKARKRLQETLVSCAVGGEELDKLSLPTRPDDVDCSHGPSSCAEKYSSEWLLESVWAVLGWELAI